MSRKNKRRSNRSGSSASRKKGRRGQNRSFVARVKAGWVARKPIFLFVFAFGVLMGLFYAFITFTPLYKDHFFPAYLDLNAELSGLILKALGQEVMVASQVISSSNGHSISIQRGCDAIEPSALLAAVVLAFPAPLLRKIAGIVSGVSFLLALNLVRIITLFFINLHFSQAWFHFFHVVLWPVVFILLAIVCWVLWIEWSTPTQGVNAHVAD